MHKLNQEFGREDVRAIQNVEETEPGIRKSEAQVQPKFEYNVGIKNEAKAEPKPKDDARHQDEDNAEHH